MGKKSGTPPSTAVPPNNKVFFSTLDWAQESTTPEYNYARCTIVYSRVVFPIRRVRDIIVRIRMARLLAGELLYYC